MNALASARRWGSDALVDGFIVAASATIFAPAAIVIVGIMTAVASYRILRRPAAVDPLILIIGLNAAYWVVSAFVLAAVPADNLLRFSFWRWPGRVFFYYAAFVWFLSVSIAPARARIYLSWAVLLAAGIAMLGSLQLLFDFRLPHGLELAAVAPSAGEGSAYLRLLTGLAADHSSAGAYFGLMAIAGLGLATTRFRASLPRSLIWSATGAVLVALILTASRAAYLGVAVAGLYIAVGWLRRDRRRAIVMSGVAAMAAILIATAIGANVTARQHAGVFGRLGHTNLSDPNVSGRLGEWAESAPLVTASPFLGIGFSRWADVFPQEFATSATFVDIHDGRFAGSLGLVWLARGFPVVNADISAHSSYLAFMSETGLLGVLLLGWFWVAVWQSTRSNAVESAQEPGDLARTAQAAILFAACCSFFEGGFSAPSVGMPLALIAGLSIAAAKFSQAAQPVAAAMRGEAAVFETAGPGTVR